jgi:hypothetical protein
MAKIPERLSQLLKSPAEASIAHDFLDRKLRENPPWVEREPARALETLAQAGHAIEPLRAWCAQWLTAEQIQVLRQALRMASQHQRVYKRTAMLSPRAHLLVKTLAELEGLSLSEAIERHLGRTLGERYGLILRTTINEHTGQIDHAILPPADNA